MPFIFFDLAILQLTMEVKKKEQYLIGSVSVIKYTIYLDNKDNGEHTWDSVLNCWKSDQELDWLVMTKRPWKSGWRVLPEVACNQLKCQRCTVSSMIQMQLIKSLK